MPFKAFVSLTVKDKFTVDIMLSLMVCIFIHDTYV